MGRFSIAELLAPLKGRVPTSSSGDRCGAACPSVPLASLARMRARGASRRLGSCGNRSRARRLQLAGPLRVSLKFARGAFAAICRRARGRGSGTCSVPDFAARFCGFAGAIAVRKAPRRRATRFRVREPGLYTRVRGGCAVGREFAWMDQRQ